MIDGENLKTFSASACVRVALAVSRCGRTPGDRAVSDGLLGAGRPARAIGSLLLQAGAGAVIGGLGCAAPSRDRSLLSQSRRVPSGAITAAGVNIIALRFVDRVARKGRPARQNSGFSFWLLFG